MKREKLATIGLTLEQGRALEEAINDDGDLQPIALKLRLAMQKAFKTKPSKAGNPCLLKTTTT